MTVQKPTVLLFGNTQFSVTDTIKIQANGTRIVGCGVGVTKFVNDGNDTNKPTFLLGVDASHTATVRNLMMEYVELLGRPGNQNGDAIQMTGLQDSVVQHVEIEGHVSNGTAGIRISNSGLFASPESGCFFNKIIDVRIANNNAGIVIAGGTGHNQCNLNLVSGCVIALTQAGAGVTIGPNAWVNIVEKCDFEQNSGASDLHVTGDAEGNRIENCHFEGNKPTRLYGIWQTVSGAQNPRDLVVTGCHLTGATQRGIALDGGYRTRIIGCFFDQNAAGSILATSNSAGGAVIGCAKGTDPVFIADSSVPLLLQVGNPVP